MIVIIDYGMGNLGSIQNMLKRLGIPAIVSAKPEDITPARALILPGVGSFDRGIQNLKDSGLCDILQQKVLDQGVPILGICLGMQIMTRGSEEGSAPGLGWLAADTLKFSFPENPSLKVPHMGWNTADVKQASPLFTGLYVENRFYFVHSYYVKCEDESIALSATTHGREFISAVQYRNIFGVQFHPEKSHRFGMTLLANFARNS